MSQQQTHSLMPGATFVSTAGCKGQLVQLWSYLQKDWCRTLSLVLIAFAIHAPAISGEFIWDDAYLAHENPLIKSPLFLLEVFRHYLFLDSLSLHYRPVQNWSFIFDYFLWNDNTFGYHLTNISLHAGAGVLLYFLLKRLLPSFKPALSSRACSGTAFLLSLLWMVHPVHSAAVDYISGRADSLAFVFACSAWLLYLRGIETAKRSAKVTLFVCSALSCLLALCSRETALLWLLIFLLYSLIFIRSSAGRSKVTLILSCAFILAAYAFLHHLPGSRAGASVAARWSAPMRAVLMLRALGDYGRLMIFPTNLHMERTVVNVASYSSYQSWEDAIGDDYLSLGGLLVAVLLIGGCLRHGSGQRLRVFGASWFVIGYLPISNLFDLDATVAEHWLYLPSVGLLLFAAGIVLELSPHYWKKLSFAAVAAAIALSGRSLERSSDWRTPKHFYEQTLAAGGQSTRVALNLGQLYVESGDYPRAEAAFRAILATYPDYPVARTNLGNVLFHEGKRREAEALFAAATASAPQARKEYARTWIAALNLAGMKAEQKDQNRALAILDKARADYPGVWELVSFESELLRKSKGASAAIPLVEQFRATNWWSYPATFALGQLYLEKGEIGKAEDLFRRASWLDIHEVEALNRLAEIHLRENRLADACATQRRAIARQPDRPREYLYLSRILEKMGRMAEAHQALAMVTRLENSVPVSNSAAAN